MLPNWKEYRNDSDQWIYSYILGEYNFKKGRQLFKL